VDYRWLYGGRASAKSASAATMAAVLGYAEPLRILCTRELQGSIRESFHAELRSSIARYDFLSDAYDVGIDYIRNKRNGTEFFFRGLKHNATAIKSIAKIDLAIVEEAEDTSEDSWGTLTGTVREPKSEIWALWNPKRKGSAVDMRFRMSAPERGIGCEINHADNPWFSERSRREMEYDKARDYGFYLHKWEGAYLERDDSQVFKNWSVQEFDTPPDALHRLGADWGFAQDPTVLVRCHIVGRKLYVDYEAYQIGCEIVDTPSLFHSVPDSERWPMVADSARPETISHMRKHGYPKIQGAIKGARSVEEGVEWLKSYDIVVNPRCKHLIDELTLYSYVIDPQTNKPTNVLADKHNHVIDALRYACEGARRAAKTSIVRAIALPSYQTWNK
jgi:phage terminase large subunit